MSLLQAAESQLLHLLLVETRIGQVTKMKFDFFSFSKFWWNI